MRAEAVESPESIGCPRCVWARMTSGGDARRRLLVTLRAHVVVWHPDVDADALLAAVAPSSARAGTPARRPPGPPPAAIG